MLPQSRATPNLNIAMDPKEHWSQIFVTSACFIWNGGPSLRKLACQRFHTIIIKHWFILISHFHTIISIRLFPWRTLTQFYITSQVETWEVSNLNSQRMSVYQRKRRQLSRFWRPGSDHCTRGEQFQLFSH